MNINGWQMMIPLAFFAGTGYVRFDHLGNGLLIHTCNFIFFWWRMLIWSDMMWKCRVRVANELGAGNGNAARFSTVVAVVTSTAIGLVFFALILGFQDKFALIFTSSKVVLKAVDKLSVLLALTILLNSLQPILSGDLQYILFHLPNPKTTFTSVIWNAPSYNTFQVWLLGPGGKCLWLI